MLLVRPMVRLRVKDQIIRHVLALGTSIPPLSGAVLLERPQDKVRGLGLGLDGLGLELGLRLGFELG
eukprot:1377252-Amorphochlora_amoeboformis.AAC.1